MSHSPVEVVVHPVFSEDELTRLRRENAALRDRMESSELEQDDWYEGMERWVHVADDLLEHCDFLDRKIRALKKQRGALHQTVAALQARAQVLEHEKAAEAAQRSLAAAAAAAAASQAVAVTPANEKQQPAAATAATTISSKRQASDENQEPHEEGAVQTKRQRTD